MGSLPRDRLKVNHWGDSPMIHASSTRLPTGILWDESLGSLPNDSFLDGLPRGCLKSPYSSGITYYFYPER